MTTLYLAGTLHSSKKSKNTLEYIFTQYKFDVFLIESPKQSKSEWYRKEPFIFLPYLLYSSSLNKKGSEFTLADKFAKENNIPVINMDKSFDELINYFHKPYNNVVFVIIMILIELFLNPVLFKLLPFFAGEMVYLLYFVIILLSFILAEVLYFPYFVFSVTKLRDTSFYEKISEVKNNGLYTSILIICGKFHNKPIMEKFADVKDLTNIF